MIGHCFLQEIGHECELTQRIGRYQCIVCCACQSRRLPHAGPQVSTPLPVNIPVAPPKSADFSAQVKAQQQALQQALEELNQQAAQSKLSVGFNLDKASGMQYVQVTNANSGDVVMQFPSNKMLDIAASIEQLKGMLYNKKA